MLRKSQVHPTVIFEALKTVISTSSAGLNPSDCFIQICGGTPEPCVAAIMMGFQKAIYIANETELEWMRLPTKEEEDLHKIDYLNYSSPDLGSPSRGFLGAAAVRMLAPYVRNAVLETQNSIMVPPPYLIAVPPIQQYVFIPLTGRIVARTIAATNPAFQSPAEKKKGALEASPAGQAKAGSSAASSVAASSSSAGGPGSQTGSKEPKTPQTKGKIVESNPKEDEGKDDDEDGNEADEEEEENLEEELAELEAMEQQGKPAPKKRGAPKKKNGPPKKKAKAS